MAINDFIMSTLNVEEDQLESFNCAHKDGVLYLYVSLKNVAPCCPFCGGKAFGNGSRERTYNHLPISGIPSSLSTFLLPSN